MLVVASDELGIQFPRQRAAVTSSFGAPPVDIRNITYVCFEGISSRRFGQKRLSDIGSSTLL